MLAVRIIPCLDVKDGRVVKGQKFRNHRDVGAILEHASFYRDAGADELVFYDITASSESRMVQLSWVTKVSTLLDIPFTVAGGISSVAAARRVFKAGADKISINSPALERPQLIRELAAEFGSQSLVVGIDSLKTANGDEVYLYTGAASRTLSSGRKTADWVEEAQDLGAGELVLNSMNQDGVKKGYDIELLQSLKPLVKVPLVASGGAGKAEDFFELFTKTGVNAALAASIFHDRKLSIEELKEFLAKKDIVVRL